MDNLFTVGVARHKLQIGAIVRNAELMHALADPRADQGLFAVAK